MLSLHEYNDVLCLAIVSLDNDMSIALTCEQDVLNGMVLPPTPQKASVIVLEDDEGMHVEMYVAISSGVTLYQLSSSI